MKRQDKKLVYVAMSGGVDSSVASALLKKHGFSVVGVFMKPWSPDLSTVLPITTPRVVSKVSVDKCMWKEDREDAMRAASVLGIPFKTWDFSKQYKKSVTDYMVREYKAGRTPNPDVMCNKEIKFGLFFDKAMKEGADFIATGHYVKIVKQLSQRLPLVRPASSLADFRRSLSPSENHARSLLESRFWTNRFTYHLHTAQDKNKDQSYFLWILKQKQLTKCLFPIGGYLKPEVRKL